MNNNKGITLIALIIMVVLMIIIASVTINTSNKIAEAANFENIKTNLLLIQSKCKIIAEKNAIGEITEDELYGTKQLIGDYSNWYILSRNDLNNMGLKDLNDEDGYYVDYENDDVAYAKGITYNKVLYYKLSEMTNN